VWDWFGCVLKRLGKDSKAVYSIFLFLKKQEAAAIGVRIVTLFNLFWLTVSMLLFDLLLALALSSSPECQAGKGAA
jgi:hypothetical protein